MQNIRPLIEYTEDEAERQHLEALTDHDIVKSQIIDKRISLLDLVEQNAGIVLPFTSFLTHLPAMNPRHYSISSSPLVDPTSCSLTYTVIDQPSWSDSQKRFVGITGRYLASLRPGDQALVGVRNTNKLFRLPASPETTPLLLFGAGSGIAPFRGFLQERAALLQKGFKLAPALLFMGCRHADRDRLYADEVDAWVRDGIVDVRYAFSQMPDHGLSGGCARLPARVLKDRDDIFALFDAGAKVYTCGSTEFTKDLSVAGVKVTLERWRVEDANVTETDVENWMQEHRNERFVSDVFS